LCRRCSHIQSSSSVFANKFIHNLLQSLTSGRKHRLRMEKPGEPARFPVQSAALRLPLPAPTERTECAEASGEERERPGSGVTMGSD
jgi:hypothetical protein